MRIVVSTTGTSILTHGCNQQTRALLTETANLSEDELKELGKLEEVEARVLEQSKKLLDAGIDEARKMSAELNGLGALGVLDCGPSGSKTTHYLIHTDTYQGKRVAQVLSEWLRAKVKSHAQCPEFNGLSTRSLQDFQATMADLAEWASEVLQPSRAKGVKVTFNLTGGFKSVNGFLQSLATFYADETVYLFESSPELLRIPRLPLALASNESFAAHLSVYRQLSLFGELPIGSCQGIPESMLLMLDDKASLSAWGEMLWKEAKPGFYEERLLAPLSAKIQLSQSFEKSVQDLPPDRRRLINERLDDLANYLESNRKAMPSSLNLQKLVGKPVAGSTHEFYAWSDQDARRGFGHFRGETFVVDQLGKHL